MAAADTVQKLGRIKACVDRGFSQVGRTLNAEDPTARIFMLVASRAISMANAVILLAEHDHSHEGLPILRGLFELSTQLVWVSERDTVVRARQALAEYADPSWEKLWQSVRLQERMVEFGWSAQLQRISRQTCYGHIHGNAQGLPWGHVFAENNYQGMTQEEFLETTLILMRYIVKALDRNWPGKFVLEP